MKRTQSEVLQKVLSNVDPETKARVNLEMECLAEWDALEDDIFKEMFDEGLEIDYYQRYKLVNLTKTFYNKGIDDAYNKLKK